MSKAKENALMIKEACKNLGWEYSVRGTVLEITKEFEPDNNDEFCKADSEYYEILSLLPTTSAGSVWGNDGSGVGAVSAVKNGLLCMKKSGGSKRVLNALSKLQ